MITIIIIIKHLYCYTVRIKNELWECRLTELSHSTQIGSSDMLFPANLLASTEKKAKIN